MVEFEIQGKSFRFEKLIAMDQFHVSRKIAPLLPALLPVFSQFKKNPKLLTSDDDILDKLGPLLQPFADGLATMSDEASEYVFSTCLSAIRYRHGSNWIQYWNKDAKCSMVMELNDVTLMLQLVLRVIAESLGPFIAGFLTRDQEPDSQA